MVKKILALIKEELAERRKDKLFKKISALKFDGQYFAWLAKQMNADTKITVKVIDGSATIEYTIALIRGNVLDVQPAPRPVPKPGVRAQ